MKKKTIDICGMHCRSCELLLEDGIKEIKGVKGVNVNRMKGTAEINYKGHLDLNQVKLIVEEGGYSLGKAGPVPWISRNKEDWWQLLFVAKILIVMVIAGLWLGVFELGSLVSSNYSSLPVVFLVGLTAGVSTCMALVGGLVLGVSAKFVQQNPQASQREKFVPHLMFNLGRVVTFLAMGAVIGWLGSVLQISMSVVGFLTILVGMSMLFLGLQLIDVFPRLSGVQLTLPKSLGRVLGIDGAKQAQYSHRNAAILGGLTFFLPCGFTQAMQLFAMSSGSPVVGALTMGTFALGTAPGLLGIGGLASVVKGQGAQYFFKFAGLAVIAFSLFNISNGLNLTGLKVSAGSWLGNQPQAKTVLGAVNANEVKVLSATSAGGSIEPSRLITTVGQPTRLEIKAEDNGAGCKFAVAIPGLTKQTARLVKGETIKLEFTPTKSGTYPIVCTSMGMGYGAAIIVQ